MLLASNHKILLNSSLCSLHQVLNCLFFLFDAPASHHQHVVKPTTSQFAPGARVQTITDQARLHSLKVIVGKYTNEHGSYDHIAKHLGFGKYFKIFTDVHYILSWEITKNCDKIYSFVNCTEKKSSHIHAVFWHFILCLHRQKIKIFWYSFLLVSCLLQK